MIYVVATFALVALLIAAMLATMESAGEMVLALFAIFTPLSFVGGVMGLLYAAKAAARYGWQHRTSGLVVLSLLAMAWAQDAFRSMVRRAGQMAGYHDALDLDTNAWRIWSGIVLAMAVLLVLRWGTHEQIVVLLKDRPWARVAAEAWAVVGLAWAAFVVFEGHHLNAGLVWIYLQVSE